MLHTRNMYNSTFNTYNQCQKDIDTVIKTKEKGKLKKNINDNKKNKDNNDNQNFLSTSWTVVCMMVMFLFIPSFLFSLNNVWNV